MPRAATTADVFNALGDGTRRTILESLAAEEASVGALVDRLRVAQPQVSKHLKVLREVDLVQCRTEGRQRVYRVNAPALAPMQTWLAELTRAVNASYDRLDDHLQRLQRAPGTTTPTPPPKEH